MAENKKQDRLRKKQNIQSDIVDNEKKNLRNKETNIIAKRD
jgi:penicillin-binding protein A